MKLVTLADATLNPANDNVAVGVDDPRRRRGHRANGVHYDDIVDHCCEAWNKLIDQPWRIMSIGIREWAKEY